METLFVYALLCSVGFDVWCEYENALNDLFMGNPNNDEYLILEGMSKKEAVLHTISLMQIHTINHDTFGKALMNAIKPIYEKSKIDEFGRRMYQFWNRLPDTIGKREDPFHVFSYADDCLSYGDEKQCRDLYEGAMSYYE